MLANLEASLRSISTIFAFRGEALFIVVLVRKRSTEMYELDRTHAGFKPAAVLDRMHAGFKPAAVWNSINVFA
jgi:hypothetical protein